MELQRRLEPPRDASQAFVATIGGFDGIHLGHQELLRRTRESAEASGCRSVVVSFEPLPREYFAKAAPPGRLTSFRERWRCLAARGIDVFCVLGFNSRLQNQTASEFAAALVGSGIRHVVVGHDFKAGKGGEGDVEFLTRAGRRLGFEVEVVEPVCVAGERVSSRAVREALAIADLARAARLLGRRYAMRGRVVRGEQLGRTLGFPTANLRLGRRRSPLGGIFAVRVNGVQAGRAIDGVASLGTRPTVGGVVPLLETHLFDFSGDLYGREIEVEFIARLREELRFASVDEMVERMHRDARDACEALAIAS